MVALLNRPLTDGVSVFVHDPDGLLCELSLWKCPNRNPPFEAVPFARPAGTVRAESLLAAICEFPDHSNRFRSPIRRGLG